MNREPIDLARLFVPRHLIAELTSRCNLRCRYCQKASDAWNALPGRDRDIDPEVLERLFESLRRVPFPTIQLSGIGEFTFHPAWVDLVARFRRRRMNVAIISNFARPLSDDELDALLRLRHLMVSIDTVDAELLKRVRRSVQLSTIVTNLLRLRMRARKLDVDLPRIRLNAVLYRENLPGIADLAYFAVENGVHEMQYERMVPSELQPPTDIASATPTEAREALKQANAARTLLLTHGISPSFHGDLLPTLERIAGGAPGATTSAGMSAEKRREHALE